MEDNSSYADSIVIGIRATMIRKRVKIITGVKIAVKRSSWWLWLNKNAYLSANDSILKLQVSAVIHKSSISVA